MFILVLLPSVAPADHVPVITSVVTAGTFGANADPIVEGTLVVTVGLPQVVGRSIGCILHGAQFAGNKGENDIFSSI